MLFFYTPLWRSQIFLLSWVFSLSPYPCKAPSTTLEVTLRICSLFLSSSSYLDISNIRQNSALFHTSQQMAKNLWTQALWNIKAYSWVKQICSFFINVITFLGPQCLYKYIWVLGHPHPSGKKKHLGIKHWLELCSLNRVETWEYPQLIGGRWVPYHLCLQSSSTAASTQ